MRWSSSLLLWIHSSDNIAFLFWILLLLWVPCWCRHRNLNNNIVLGFAININNNNNNYYNKGDLSGIWKIQFSEDVSFLPFSKYVDDQRNLILSQLTPSRSDPFDISTNSSDDNSRKQNELQHDYDDDDDENEDDDYSVVGNNKKNKDAEVLIKLNVDGTFRQCSEGYKEGCWMSGMWDIVRDDDSSENDNINYNYNDKIVFALDRQYYGPRYDILLEGKFDNESTGKRTTEVKEIKEGYGDNEQRINQKRNKIISGIIRTGKFMYPKKHPSFFDEPVIVSTDTTLGMKSCSNGTFIMEQSISTNSIFVQTFSSSSESSQIIDENKNTDDNNNTMATVQPENVTQQQSKNNSLVNFQPSDFLDRNFLMTIEPISFRTSRSSSSSTVDKATDADSIIQSQAIDFRVLPIQFHRNNTFQAYGVNKILRGRYGIQQSKHKYDTPNKKLNYNELWFQVSLFGAGRSAPGSVYSEGNGLSHEDQRLYIGEIIKQNDRLYVSGTVLFGSDLGTDARMEPVAKFLLTETTTAVVQEEVPAISSSQAIIMDDSNDDPKDELDSIFE